MPQWHPVSAGDVRLLEGISLLLSSHTLLLSFLFDKYHPRLREEPEVLLEQSQCFSRGERILIKVALDLWSNSQYTNLRELLDGLDQANYENVLSALQYLGTDRHYQEWVKKDQREISGTHA